MRYVSETSLIALMRSGNGFTRAASLLTVACFLFTVYSPGILAAKEINGDEKLNQAITPSATTEAGFATTLQAIKDEVAKQNKTIGQRLDEESGLVQSTLDLFGFDTLATESLDELTRLSEQLRGLYQQNLASFEQLETELKVKAMANEILQRHYAAVAKYQLDYQKLQSHIQDCRTADSLSDQRDAMNALNDFMQGIQIKTSRPPFDPNRLPFNTPAGEDTRKPITDSDQLGRLINAETETLFAESIGNLVIARAHAQAENVPVPGDLAETIEVRITDAIRQKAQELENNPVNISNWVRNNIEWIPGWGAVQTANHTFMSRRGNAFDNSSLLIALLRAAEFPARYVHGVVDIPTQNFRNWAGNFESLNAALDYVSAAGVPVTTLTSAGRIVKVRIEHVWVEAFVDYQPSRGAKFAQGDSWVPLDPSFNAFVQPVTPDVVSLAGIDPLSVNQSLLNSGTQNLGEGWVLGINPAILDQLSLLSADAASAIQDAEQSFFEQNYASSANVGIPDLIGGYKLIESTPPVLTSTTPYKVFTVLTRYSQIPEAFRAQIELGFGVDIFDNFSHSIPLPVSQVNSEKLTLSFTFAEQIDHDTFASLFPDEIPASIDELPSEFPGYLIRMVPELRLNDEVILRGNAVRYGDDFSIGYTFKFPGQNPTKKFISNLPVGAHVGIGTIVGSINTNKFDVVSDRLTLATSLLETATTDEILDQITNIHNQITSDTFYLGILEYLGKQFATAEVIGRAAKTGEIQLLVAGTIYGHTPTVNFFFGIPRTVEAGPIVVDAQQLLFNAQSTDGDLGKRADLLTLMGIYGSSLEGDSPAQLFALDDAAPPQGYSSANNIQIALDQGQRIYSINNQNRSELANINFTADVISDMNAAIDRGFEVITHTDILSISGNRGDLTTAGYIIRNPVNGAAAYLIDNGTNGGITDTADGMLASCAYTNRPGFVNNIADYKRLVIVRSCADLSREIKEETARTQKKRMKGKVDAIKKYMKIYAKAPGIIADCMIQGAPLFLLELIVLIRTLVAILAINTAQMKAVSGVELSGKIADKIQKVMDYIVEFCEELGSDP